MDGAVRSIEGRQKLDPEIRKDGFVPQIHNNNNNPFHTPFDERDEDEDSTDDDREIAVIVQDDKPSASRRTQWPALSNYVTPPPLPHNPQTKTRKSVKRHSVQKPTREKSRLRQKRQNERAGIKVNTNFSRHHGPPPAIKQPITTAVDPRPAPEAGRFVDLAALQALESRAPTNGSFWKSLLGNTHNVTATAPQTSSHQGHGRDANAAVPGPTKGFGSRRGKNLKPPSLNLGDDLSPGDRPIVIGISIPSATLDQHVRSPQTAGSETSNIIQSYESRTPRDNIPETPVIVITPAEVSYWSPISANTMTPQSRRVPSIMDSRQASDPFGASRSSEVPPMPLMPIFVPNNQKSGRDSVGTVFSEDEDEILPAGHKKPRIMSSGTIFEEDDSPILSRKKRAGSDSSILKPKSIFLSTENRTSVGWWNTIVSPFLSRPNTLLSPQTAAQGERPPLPNIATSGTKTNNIGDISTWEKSLSPKSPLSSTTIASDTWWEGRNTIDGAPKPAEADFRPKSEIHSHEVQDSYGTLPFMLSAGGLEITVPADQQLHLSGNTSTASDTLRRDQSLTVLSNRTSIISPSDREAPFMLDDSAISSMNAIGSTAVMRASSQSIQPHSLAAAPSTINTTSAAMPPQVQPQQSSESSTRSGNPPPPPPYSPPRVDFPRYRVVYPPGHVSDLQQPQSPGPLSPGLQQAISSSGAIALTEVPLTPPPRRVINLNSGYPSLPPRTGNMPMNPVDLERASEKALKIEVKRQRHEKEDVIAHKAGGLWRGRGCISNRGCYGRSGSEGRKRRRCCFGLIAGFLALAILIPVLVTQLHRTASPPVDIPSQWLNITAFPPIYTGASTVSSPENTVANTGCVYPKTVWSCALPKELQSSVAPNEPDQPNLRLFIQWDNSSAGNATWGGPTTKSVRSVGNAVTAGQLIKRLALQARQAIKFSPSPAPPTVAEQSFLGNTTDGVVSDNKAGEQTPFYISFLDPSADATTPSQLSKRQVIRTGEFPDFTKSIPAPDLKADGTAAAANLLPLPMQQPLRLFDRGLPTEHYGFYTYFSRSIFLKSTALLNATNAGSGEVPDDLDGGCRESEARFRCTWAETRFLVQMWTKKGGSAALLNSTSSNTTDTSLDASQAARNSTQPSVFPYPVTITTDRHGGDPAKKGVYCYELDVREKVVAGSAKVRPEFRGFGGTLINQAPSDFNSADSNASLGGFDGGDSGCSCQWANWNAVI